jgi:hypothetical protein
MYGKFLVCPEGRQQTLDIRQQTANSRQADSRQQTADSRHQTADSRQWTGDSRQETAESRQQTGDRNYSNGIHLGVDGTITIYLRLLLPKPDTRWTIKTIVKSAA